MIGKQRRGGRHAGNWATVQLVRVAAALAGHQGRRNRGDNGSRYAGIGLSVDQSLRIILCFNRAGTHQRRTDRGEYDVSHPDTFDDQVNDERARLRCRHHR